MSSATCIVEPLREGAGGDEVDDAAGVHRVAAQVNSVPQVTHMLGTGLAYASFSTYTHLSPCTRSCTHMLTWPVLFVLLPFCQEEQRLLARCLHLQRSHKVSRISHDSWQRLVSIYAERECRNSLKIICSLNNGSVAAYGATFRSNLCNSGIVYYVWQASSARAVAGEDRQGGRKQGPLPWNIQWVYILLALC